MKNHSSLSAFLLKTKSKKKYLHGFTLVELIIVITILTILGTISFISFQDYFADARDANRVTTISNIKQSLDLQKMKTRKYPTPAQALSYTGGNTEIQQGVINKEILSDMSNDPKDPGSGEYYTYSITKNGKYYQLAAQLENEVGYKSFVSKTYANDYATVKVEGNYKFDPSFPSLIIVPSSYTSGSGIFAPSVCFVLDGGVNTLTTCTQKKSEMSLKEYDKSLVGYWDMETLCAGGNCGGGNDGYPKNLATNDINILSGTVLKNHNNANFITKTQTGNAIMGQKSAYITDFDSALQTSGNIKNIEKTLTVQMLVKPNFSTMFNGQYSGIWDRNFLFDYYNTSDNYTRFALLNDKDGLYSYRNNGGSIKSNNFNYQMNKVTLITMVLNNSLSGTTDYSNNSLFIDGKKVGTNSTPGNKLIYSNTGTIFHFGSESSYPGMCSASYPQFVGLVPGCTFNGTFDDIKIYNRALSDQEIAQQAKMAEF